LLLNRYNLVSCSLLIAQRYTSVATMASATVLCKATQHAMRCDVEYIWDDVGFWSQHGMHPFGAVPELAKLHFPLLGREYDGYFAAAAVHRNDIALLILGCITTAQCSTWICSNASKPEEVTHSTHTVARLACDFAGCKDSQIRVVVGTNKLSFTQALHYLWTSPMDLLNSTKAALQRLDLPMSWLANFEKAGQQGDYCVCFTIIKLLRGSGVFGTTIHLGPIISCCTIHIVLQQLIAKSSKGCILTLLYRKLPSPHPPRPLCLQAMVFAHRTTAEHKARYSVTNEQ
jgi:hypothetical protein